MPYKDRDVRLLNRRLCKLRKAIREGRSYSPRTPEMREERTRRKLYWRVVRAIYCRLKTLGWVSPAKKAKAERANAYKRRLTDLRGRKRRVRLTPEQRMESRREGKINRRLREKRTRVSAGIIEKLKVLQKHRCAACQQKLKTFHMDHIVPLARGGAHRDDNVQLLCPPCNLRKAAKDPIHFMQELGRLV